MALSAEEIGVGYSVKDEKRHIAICHGCGFRVQYVSQAGVYERHNVNTCLLFLRPVETRPKWLTENLQKYIVGDE